MTKTLDQFREKHDPAYEIHAPRTVFSRALSKQTKRYIITAAQNGTPVNTQWWATLCYMAGHINAEILVIPLRYKNPTSRWTGSMQNAEWWAPEVTPYLWNVRSALNQNITLLADIKTQPTAVSPLDGADAMSLTSSGIIGHPKVQMKSIPTPQSRMAKILTTTGACTVANYTDTRVGKVAEFHHSLSAVLVEVDGRYFALRHLHWDGLGCTDISTRYIANGYSKAERAFALKQGDTHTDAVCPLVDKATFGEGGIVEETEPEYVIWDDLLDSYSCNPHHKGNPFFGAAKRKASRDSVRAEVNRAIEHVRARTRKKQKSIVVPSNHVDFLSRWVVSADWKAMDGDDGDFYLETALAMRRSTKLTEKGTEYADPFTYWFRKANVKNARVLDLDESFAYKDVELGMHGDRGPNGARGSIRNLRRIGVKSVIGHSHTPGIDEGCYQVGTSTRLRLEYNHGASGWLNAHCIVHANGKRQIIVIVDGRWRL